MVDGLAACTRSMFWRQHLKKKKKPLATAYISLFGKKNLFTVAKNFFRFCFLFNPSL